jgi:hypothetical protein
MSLQGGYLGQIALDGSGCVKLPDVFTVFAQIVHVEFKEKAAGGKFKIR